MSSPTSTPSPWAARQSANTRHLAAWTGAWLVTMAVATFGSQLVWPDATGWKVAAIAVNVAVGVGMILANKRHLLGLDELHQRVQLEAMGLTLGVGLVAGLAYSTLDVTHVISADAEISHLVMLMGLTYLAGVIVGLRKLA